jgi:hypothetical protein
MPADITWIYPDLGSSPIQGQQGEPVVKVNVRNQWHVKFAN